MKEQPEQSDTRFENDLLQLMTELYTKRLEYEDCSADGKNINWEYFKGKAEAYAYAHKKLVDLMKWHGKKL